MTNEALVCVTHIISCSSFSLMLSSVILDFVLIVPFSWNLILEYVGTGRFFSVSPFSEHKRVGGFFTKAVF